MSETIPSELIRLFRDRRALLWVCQRYDLLPGEEPHDYKLPPSEASLRYRPEPESTDFKLAARYWEAVWVEGARSPLLEVFRATAEKQLPGASRAIVVLASDTDSRALVSSQEFLTICVLPGLIDKEAVPEAQYGKVRARARERAAWNLSARLTLYQQRLLVVIGAREGDDLNDLYEVLEDNPIADLNLLVIWPKDEPFPSAPENPAVSLYFWTDSIEQL